MIINFTIEEEAKLKNIEESYDRLIAECEAIIEARPDDLDEEKYKALQESRLREPIELRPAPIEYDKNDTPIYDGEAMKKYRATAKYKAYAANNEEVNKAIDELFREWEEAGSKEWKEARKRWHELDEKKSEAIRGYIAECELRQFRKLGDDINAIYANAVEQAKQIIEKRYEYYKNYGDPEGGYFSSVDVRALGGDKFLLDAEELLSSYKNALHLHFKALEAYPDLYLQLEEELKRIVAESPLTSYEEGKKFGRVEVAKHETTEKRGYRRSADIHDRVKKYPDAYIVPTLNGYQNAVSLYQDGNAYLQPLITTDNLQFRDGKLFFKGRIEQISEVELQDLKTKQGIEEINLNLLGSYYGIILNQFYEKINKKEKLSPVIKLAISDLAAYMGKRPNQTKEEIEALIKHTQSFHNIIGVEHITRNGKPDKSYWPLLNFEGYDASENSISFSSPYINHIVETIYKQSIRRDKNGKAKFKSDGKTPLTVASHSYLIKGSIAAERNRDAVQNVVIIVDIIERAGKNTPHFRIQTVIDRNPQLKQRLENSSNKVQLLRRVFTKTWELLKKQTILTEVYSNIQLPDPKNPGVIPTLKTLEEMVIEIPHDGKRR